MKARQARKQMGFLLLLLAGLAACSPSNVSQPPQQLQTATTLPAAASPTRVETITLTPAPTSRPSTCLTKPGRVREGVLETTDPPQEFRIYLPPCYDESKDQRYPVLYLLHGQTYSDDQWIRLGAANVADKLIRSGESHPFIIVFPDDRHWNLEAGAGFGTRLVDDLISYLDLTYRTLPDRNHRAIGGLSRGAGWALQLGLTRWELFGSIGLHSLAVLQRDASRIPDWLSDIPPNSRPRVFMDIGDNDPEQSLARSVENQFNEYGLAHEWHLYSGAHAEEYWGAHVEEYIRWYAEGWVSTR